ncbi:glr1066 [Gloeobacter violaceus PCC 7421]|uniref:Glr1066 protein n=2 Tax=Gloeobacter violaceus TaxID=33072 RepID=Q7NLQ5_GLOVI|nr:glr1066 [Gloeobacter violaceus PCC 7421]
MHFGIFTMRKPTVCLIVSPRERFSYTRESLESLYTHTDYPFKLVYVDGGSPEPVQRYLQQQAALRGFELIRTAHYLAPNQARNLGLARCGDSDYVVFVDNDIQVTPGWLERLVDCAETTGAAVVGPLVCIGTPGEERVHLAGGEARILQQTGEDGRDERRIHEKHYFVNRPLAEVLGKTARRPCEFAEFHCVLVRASLMGRLGPLDEKLLSTREHIDFCLTVQQAGGSIWVEPDSVVTYVPGPPFDWSDLSYFLLRWSDAWELASLKHFRKKWGLAKDKYFQKRLDRLGHRRHQAFLRPLVRALSLGGEYDAELEAMLSEMEKQLNRYLTDRLGASATVPPAPVPTAAAAQE